MNGNNDLLNCPVVQLHAFWPLEGVYARDTNLRFATHMLFLKCTIRVVAFQLLRSMLQPPDSLQQTSFPQCLRTTTLHLIAWFLLRMTWERYLGASTLQHPHLTYWNLFTTACR